MSIVSLGQVIVSHWWVVASITGTGTFFGGVAVWRAGRFCAEKRASPGLESRWVNEAEQKRLAVAAFAVVEQLVFAAVAATRATHQAVFAFDQAVQVPPQLKFAPAERLAQLTLREADEATRPWFVL